MSHYSLDPRFYNHPSVNGPSDPRVSSRQRTASTWNKAVRPRARGHVGRRDNVSSQLARENHAFPCKWDRATAARLQSAS
jgi:hypothetical protein